MEGTCLITYAVGNIRLESGKIVDMETLSGVFAQTLQETTSSLCVNERFDYLSAGALLRGKNYYAYPPYDDAPKEGKFDWGGFFRNIAIGLAVVAVCVAAAAAVVATGGGARDRNIGHKRSHHGSDWRKIPAYEQAAGRPYRYDAQYG